MSGIVGGAGSKSGVIGETELDYETGEFTATLIGGTTAGNSPTTTAFYTKIGNSVTCWIDFYNVNTSSAAGQTVITGLPFSNSADQTCFSTQVQTHFWDFDTAKHYNFIAEKNATQLTSLEFADGAGWAGWDITAGTGKYLRTQITYKCTL